MKFNFNVSCSGDAKLICYQHPVYSNYGLALTVNEDRSAVSCAIVFGELGESQKLDILSDLTAPVDVFAWAFTIMQSIQNTVNGVSVDVENLLSTPKHFY